MFKIEDHYFCDRDIDKILPMPNSVELGFKAGTEAIVLKEDDVKALAIHFGLIKG